MRDIPPPEIALKDIPQTDTEEPETSKPVKKAPSKLFAAAKPPEEF